MSEHNLVDLLILFNQKHFEKSSTALQDYSAHNAEMRVRIPSEL